ncbi:hybrid sensor histidine kinase/response regulator [Pararhizobium arenae]|uniref:hybrid sensor histidine kinase/response regulator n=1 Tax=Pararhizobium arenae TaxID=1856850 RepID=UPI000A3F3E11|nr:PAS domain-containing sensor histidine kinase [Pararhizobium arenae]
MALNLCLNTSLPTAIYWGNDLRLLYNDAWAPIAGEKHPWALGRPAREVWADIWHVIEPQLSAVMATGEGFSVTDQVLPMKRGGRVQQTHWDYSFAPIFDANDRVLGIFNQGNETTARLSAERALRASEERLEFALGASNTVGTWDWDVPNDKIIADARFANLYGVSREKAAAGAPIAEFFAGLHPDDLPAVRDAIETAMRTGNTFSQEYRLLRPDGSIRWVMAEGRPTLAPDGTVLRFPGVSFDITERKQAEAALRDSEERFRAITNSIDQMLWSTLPDGHHDYYNQRWYDFTGVPVGSTDGEGWNGMFHPDDQERAWAVWRHCLATGEPYHIEYRLRHRSGVYRWVLGRAQAVRDTEGNITRWFGSCTDIQDIVDAREVLARSREDLEKAVEERTAKLMEAEAQLRQAQKMEAVGQLTGGVAHDFNNMLAVIISALNLLERRLARGETDFSRYIEAAKDGANRAAALTQRLLAFSRRQPLQPEVIEPNRMVTGMTELLSRALGEQVQIETVMAAGVWRINADASQLENAILNLAVNGRDAMPQGGKITVETANMFISEEYGKEHSMAVGQYVMIAVTDTGTGMTADTLSRAFDPFFTTKEVGKGSGLGLSQVFGFVRQSGGHVKIYSELGHGTSVKIYLPRHYGTGEIKGARPLSNEPARGTRDELILVVEDDARVRHFSTESLRELGYAVAEAASGPAALALLDAGLKPTLLFTDVVMPGMSGRELADLAASKIANLKILYTTGYTRNAVVHNGILDPGTHLLQKPFSLDQLAEKIRQVIDG